ncbi:carbonic anhydrase family protein [Enterococcus sp. LJL120]
MDVEWGYSGERGPENWHTLCDWFAEGAKFPLQSPIALTQSICQPDNSTYQALSIHYQKELFTEKEFKNTIHFVPFDTKSFVVFNKIEYHLTDIHFHMPSEHVIENQRQPLEFHLVHMNAAGENLVLGVLFDLTEDEGKIFNNQPDTIWDFANHLQEFNPVIFLPEKRSHYHYVGSLTTPPTKGPINWFVFDTIGKMKLDFIDLFREDVAENNSRPLQELKERQVDYYGG